VRRARLLAWFTIIWNTIEGLVGIGSGIAAGSIALIGFGVDSYVEVLSGAVVLWRCPKSATGRNSPRRPNTGLCGVIAATFFALAVGVAVESLRKLATGSVPLPVPWVLLSQWCPLS